ncbi:MAG TPA: DNA translocase FtsK, partial [Candidatus Tyrphobacter sp.]
MARVRRRGGTKKGLNLEVVGIVAIGFAVLFAVALAVPQYSGHAGRDVAATLHHLLGSGAPLFPLLIAVLGAIVFLEINVPRLIAAFGSAALAYFLLIDAILGARGIRGGGAIGATMWSSLRGLVGSLGAWIVLGIIALALTLYVSNLSLKKIIGWVMLVAGRVKIPPLPKLPKLHLSLPSGHANLRDAFSLPERPVPRVTTGSTEVFDEEAVKAPAAVPAAPLQRYVPPRAPAPRITTAEVIVGEYESGTVGGRAYRLPDLSIFDAPPAPAKDDADRAHLLEDTLASFGVGAKVVHAERGPSVTRYELKPERGVKISRIAALADDLALALAATSVRIEAPIPGKSAVGIEVPNQTVSIVSVREILDALPNRGQVPPLWMALGKDITGRPVFGDLAKMPHLLVAGATGAGKSVCLNTIIASLLVSATPDQVQMLMIDPKRVELPVYNGIPHLIKDVITDPRLAAGALLEMTKEMETRYERFAKASVRKIEEYNAKYPDQTLPYVVIVIDELADLMLIAPTKVETTIMRLAQLARATGIHLVVATQRPSVDVITGLIKANIPSRIAFAVSSQVDSRV